MCSGGNKGFPFHRYRWKKVLEIGCGGGVDAKRFIDAGADYTGIDLTHNALELTRTKIGRKAKLHVMNAELLDFPDNHFDLVYSWGVIHHTVTPENVVREMHRVCKPGGDMYVMLYNKPSIRYNLDIMFVRRLLWGLRYYKYRKIREEIPHPTRDQWISINTDNIGCPISRVYTENEGCCLLRPFVISDSFTTNWGWFRHYKGVKM